MSMAYYDYISCPRYLDIAVDNNMMCNDIIYRYLRIFEDRGKSSRCIKSGRKRSDFRVNDRDRVSEREREVGTYIIIYSNGLKLHFF